MPETASVKQTVARQAYLPGYSRPTKLLDLVVVNRGGLIAALEFKIQPEWKQHCVSSLEQ